MVSFSYVPRDVSKTFQRELWVDNIDMRDLDNKGSFELRTKDNGFIRWTAPSTTEYSLKHDDFTFTARTDLRTPWSGYADTPESFLINFPLPLHWHVHSLGSQCEFEFEARAYEVPAVDRAGHAFVHQEKNWAQSFPAAQIWIQAHDGERSFCCAGGPILGMEAFLMGYRSKDMNFDFRPPFALRIAGISPFMTYQPDWNARSFSLSVQSLRRKLSLSISAPKGSFFSLSAPFPDGHRRNYLGESFQAVLELRIFESGLLTPWRLVRADRFDNASLEFGGEYYDPRGSEQKFN